MALVITVGLVLFAIAGQAWYMWVASADGAAAVVAFLLLFQHARSKRMLALSHTHGA